MLLIEYIAAYMHVSVSLHDAMEGRGSADGYHHHSGCRPIRNEAAKIRLSNLVAFIQQHCVNKLK